MAPALKTDRDNRHERRSKRRPVPYGRERRSYNYLAREFHILSRCRDPTKALTVKYLADQVKRDSTRLKAPVGPQYRTTTRKSLNRAQQNGLLSVDSDQVTLQPLGLTFIELVKSQRLNKPGQSSIEFMHQFFRIDPYLVTSILECFSELQDRTSRPEPNHGLAQEPSSSDIGIDTVHPRPVASDIDAMQTVVGLPTPESTPHRHTALPDSAREILREDVSFLDGMIQALMERRSEQFQKL